jgi:hypothetical protein
MTKKATTKIKKKTVKKKPIIKTTAKSLSDFKKYAMVCDGPALPVTMDTTSHQQISLMLNYKFSKEKFNDADKVFSINKLDRFKKRKFETYLKEGKKQILVLWNCIESFTTHSDLFRTSFLIAIGQILNHIEKSHQSKSAYMEWLRAHFGHKHLRYFQHAKQLDNMGAFARNFASLGKNRLLELERTRKELGESFYSLLSQFPFEDTTQDHGGALFKEHVDGVITYHRMRNADVDSVEFDQAALIGAQLNGAITKKMANQISQWLNDKEDKTKALDDLILNKLAYPDSGGTRLPSRPSIRKHLADLVNYSESVDYENNDWVSSIRDQIDEADLSKAYNFLVVLANKLGINLVKTRVKNRRRKAA